MFLAGARLAKLRLARRPRRRSATLLLIAGILFLETAAQNKPLTNADVTRMIDAGLATDLIVTMIESSQSDFVTDVESILQLKARKVPDEVIRAMLKKKEASDQPQQHAGNDTASADPISEGEDPQLTEVGVYYVKERDRQLILLEPEVVTWKTGGFWKSMATAGLTKGHINGVVRRPSSNYILNGSETLYIYTASRAHQAGSTSFCDFGRKRNGGSFES